MLVLSQPKQSAARKRRTLTSEADSEVLDGLEAKEEKNGEKRVRNRRAKETKSLKIIRRRAEADNKRNAKEIQRKKKEKITETSQQTRRSKGM